MVTPPVIVRRSRLVPSVSYGIADVSVMLYECRMFAAEHHAEKKVSCEWLIGNAVSLWRRRYPFERSKDSTLTFSKANLS